MGNKQFLQRLGWLGGTKGLVFATGAAHPVGPFEAGGWEPRRCSGAIGFVHDGKVDDWVGGAEVRALFGCFLGGNSHEEI